MNLGSAASLGLGHPVLAGDLVFPSLFAQDELHHLLAHDSCLAEKGEERPNYEAFVARDRKGW